MEWTLRKAIPEDKPWIETLFVEMLHAVYQTSDISDISSADWNAFFFNERNWIYIAESNGCVIAYLSVEEHHEQETYLYLDDCSVSKAYRSYGIGTKLIQTAEQYAKDTGIPSMVLHVESSNVSARALYERLGFKVIQAEGTRFRMKKLLI